MHVVPLLLGNQAELETNKPLFYIRMLRFVPSVFHQHVVGVTLQETSAKRLDQSQLSDQIPLLAFNEWFAIVFWSSAKWTHLVKFTILGKLLKVGEADLVKYVRTRQDCLFCELKSFAADRTLLLST